MFASGLSIVLPTFTDSSIRQVIEALLLGTDHPLEILIVDDDSRDGTPIWFAPWPARIKNRIIQRVGRSGLASAIKEGLIAASIPSPVMDSDGQHEPTSVGEALVARIERTDLWAGAASPISPKSEASVIDVPMAPPSPTVWPVEPAQVLPAPERLHERLHRAAPRPPPAAGASSGRQRLQILLRTPGHKSRPPSGGRNSLRFQPRLHGNSKLDLAAVGLRRP